MSEIIPVKNGVDFDPEADDIKGLLQVFGTKTKIDQIDGCDFAMRAERLWDASVAMRRIFPDAVLRHPCFDILLLCLLARSKGQEICVKQIRCQVDESNTALLRRIDELEACGMISRRRDEVDGRRTIVELTDSGAAAMLAYLRDHAPD